MSRARAKGRDGQGEYEKGLSFSRSRRKAAPSSLRFVASLRAPIW
jgi:hypothetical protein